LLSGCATYSGQAEPLRQHYGAAEYGAAEAFVDGKIASEQGIPVETVTASNGLDPQVRVGKGDTALYLLDKAMLRMARGDSRSAVELMRLSRDQLDDNFQLDTQALLKTLGSLFTDDTALDYAGADYEHIMVRVMLTLADLIEGGGDAYAYATQIGEKQEQIIGSPLGDLSDEGSDAGYRPRESYSRVGIGAYLQGVIREDLFALEEAKRAYERALEFEGGDKPLYAEAMSRAAGSSGAVRGEAGEGYLHVFYLAGQGPHLEETRATPTTEVLKLAGWIMLFGNENPALIAQAPVPVPLVRANDSNPPVLEVVAADRSAVSQVVLDVNRVAEEQLAANLPWITARAVARRATKATIGTIAGKAAENSSGSNNGAAVGAAVNILFNLAATATENADTRSWTTLPSQIHALRLVLPEGVQQVQVGRDASTPVRITAGRNSYMLVIHPSLGRTPTLLLDRYSIPPTDS
jgi:hypothetical protein